MSNHRPFLLFLLFWFVQSLVTALNTELYFDEAYYWMYSRFLDWGYFDHPPSVAVMIWLGNFLGKTELAVRLVNILMMSGALGIIYFLVKPNNVVVFCLTLFSFLTFHLSGFVTLPDTPFFFFALVFMLAYRQFLRQASWWAVLALGASAALMLYSKYHGALVILFTVLSNPRLLTNYRFYLAGLVGVLLFLPHIIWQVNHDFPSLQYHLVDRGSSYKISQTIDYLLGNVPYHGGLVSVALLIASFGYRAADRWERALQWNLYGTLLFFLLITFKGQYIEPNWTIFCTFPLVYLGYRSVEQARWFRTYRVIAAVFAGLLLLIKVHLITPLVNIKKDRVWDFHLSQNFAREVEERAGGAMIVGNDYKAASLLNFYADQPYHIPALNVNGRANQYSIWRLDTLICNRRVAFVNQHLPGDTVTGRMYKTHNVTLIEQLTSPNLMMLRHGPLRADSALSEVIVTVAIQPDQDCAFDDRLSLEFTLLSSEAEPLVHQEPLALEQLTTDQEYRIPVANPRTVDKVLVRVISAKLGGGTNRYLTIDAPS
jgi:hypothetical protein